MGWRITTIFALLGVALLTPFTNPPQPADAAADTHYGYVVSISANLDSSLSNHCALAKTGTTMIAVPFGSQDGDNPKYLDKCLATAGAISGVVLRPQAPRTNVNAVSPIDFTTLDAMLSYNFNNPASGVPDTWLALIAKYPTKNFLLEIGNEPILEYQFGNSDPYIAHTSDWGPWTVGHYMKDSVNRLYDKYRPAYPNLHYMPALGVASDGGNPSRNFCQRENTNATTYCGLDYIKVLVEGQDVCRVGGKAWGCAFHRYWNHLYVNNGTSGSWDYSGNGPGGKEVYDYVIGSAYIPRAIVAEQGIHLNPNSSYIRNEDCALRDYTKNRYNAKIRGAFTYVVGPGPADFTYGISQTAHICY